MYFSLDLMLEIHGSQNNSAGAAAFRPRAHTTTTYTPTVEKGRPILQGLLATDLLAKEASRMCF